MGSNSKGLPEITIKAVGLGVLLSIILAAANAYLGLFAGMTVSASIPAAVVSMGVLKLFRRSNIFGKDVCRGYPSDDERRGRHFTTIEEYQMMSRLHVR